MKNKLPERQEIIEEIQEASFISPEQAEEVFQSTCEKVHHIMKSEEPSESGADKITRVVFHAFGNRRSFIDRLPQYTVAIMHLVTIKEIADNLFEQDTPF